MEHTRFSDWSVAHPVTPDGTNPRLARIMVGDYTLATDLLGDPRLPPVILLHGIPGWRGTWRPVAQLLATRTCVVAPDLAGFGESSAAPPEFHAVDHARLVVALIRTLGLRRVHVVGFDFGGPTKVMACAQAPELVASAGDVRGSSLTAPCCGATFTCTAVASRASDGQVLSRDGR